jgi:GNAT superfamily N-acetyltransferase
LKGLFKTGKGIMKVKRMMDRASVRIADGIVKEDRIDEIEDAGDFSVRKDDTTRDDFDDMIGRASPTEYTIDGYEIWLLDIGNEFVLLVKDPDSEGYLGEFRLQRDSNIDVDGVDAYAWKSTVFLDPEIQGKGMGPKIYELAIKEFDKTIVSDYQQSKGSKSLWANLAHTSGVFVYAWNVKTGQFFQWDPQDDPEEEVYWNSAEELPMTDRAGRIQKDKVRHDDIRLVATADNGLEESVGAIMGMILPTHGRMYKNAAKMMSSFSVEFPSYGLLKLAALVSRRTVKDFDKHALVGIYKKMYPSNAIPD